MKKLKLLGTTILAASLILAGCSQAVDEVIPGLENPGIETQTLTDGTKTPDSSAGAEDNAAEEDKPDAGDNAGDKEDDKKEDNNDGKGAGGDDSNTGDTGSEADLAAYVYHKSILSGIADVWNSGTTITESDGKVTMKSNAGNLWGAGGVCGVSKVKLGEIADYDYVVFTIDTSDYTISAYKESLDSNTGVNVKVHPVIARPAKWFTKNGKTTYYIAASEFASASASQTEIALIIGGEGNLVLEEFYLAATEEPAENVIDYKNTTVYSAGDTLNFVNWDVGVSAECTNEGIVANGKSPWYAVAPAAPIQFKAGAKLEVTYTANVAWNIKPVAPNVEMPMDAGENVTKQVSLGESNDVLTAIGLVLSAETTEVTITSIKVVDNE